MRNWITKSSKKIGIGLIVIGILIAVLGGPLIINWLFKRPAPVDLLDAEWESDAVLSYYGTIVASAIAVYGVFLTIRYSQKNYKEDVRNRTLPFITIDMLKTKSHITIFPEKSKSDEENTDNQEGYVEYKLQDYYCILDEGTIIYKTGLTKSQKALIENGGMKWVPNGNSRALTRVDEICVPIEIENIGNGTAVRLRYGLNRKNAEIKDRKYLPVISLKTFCPILFHIFSEDCSKQSANLGDYVLSFYYEDIYSNKYQQDFDIKIMYGAEDQSPIVSVDMSHEQRFLGGRKNG